MSIYKGAVRSAGNEMDFLTAFDTAFRAIDSSIDPTSSSVPEMYASTADGYEGYPYLEYTVGGVYKLKLSRTETLTRSSSPIGSNLPHAGKYVLNGDAVGHYGVSITHIPTGTKLANANSSYGLKFRMGVNRAHDVVVREWRVGLIKNAKALVVQISPYNRSLVDADAMADIMFVTDQNTHLYRARLSKTNSYSAYFDSGYLLDDQSSVTAVNRMLYYRDGTDESKISKIGGKVFTDVSVSNVQNSAMPARVFATDALVDCSTLSVLNRRIVINGQTHYVLDTHTIMPVS